MSVNIPVGVDCVGYLRVSTPRQAGMARTSLATQRTEVAEYATAMGRSVGHWYEDAGFSGATIEGRPAFVALLADVEASPRHAGPPGLVLAQDSSRWGRFDNPITDTLVRVRCERAGWYVRFAANGAGDAVVRPHAPLSAETQYAITDYLRASVQRRRDPLREILAGLLAEVATDARARALVRLCRDYDAHGGTAAIARVLSGDVDLVALLDGRAES